MKILKALFLSLGLVLGLQAGVLAGPIANVEYAHRYLAAKTGLDVPIAAHDARQAVNSEYILYLVDNANKSLSGTMTDYYGSRYATKQVADTVAVQQAMDTLIVMAAPVTLAGPFTVTLTSIKTNDVFDFQIAAKGNFQVDWGDDSPLENIAHLNALPFTYTHAYAKSGNYTVSIRGNATGYNPDIVVSVDGKSTVGPAISFSGSTNKEKMTAIAGNLGAIFPILKNPDAGTFGTPRFYGTFYGCSNLKGSIPANLFAGLDGAPADWMFTQTFRDCTGLTGSIPPNLFAGVNGAPEGSMFMETFAGCTGLTGSIPAGLFSNVSGAPAYQMFAGTFSGCSGLQGSIPAGLFSNVSGAPERCTFCSTFKDCTGLTGSIPGSLFFGISGRPQQYMFSHTFAGCTGLTGSIPADLFAGVAGDPSAPIAEGFVCLMGGEAAFLATFKDCTGLSGAIPGSLFAGVSGKPAPGLFDQTFSGCGKLSGIGDGLFDGIVGNPEEIYCVGNGYGQTGGGQVGLKRGSKMFRETFFGCSSLTGPSATTNGQFLYEKWPSTEQAEDCYANATKLDDYCAVPQNWGGDPAVECEIEEREIYPLICEAGEYVPEDTATCAPCPDGSYCPETHFMPFAPHGNLGINECPAGWTGSYLPRNEIANCYKEIETKETIELISGGGTLTTTTITRCYFGTIGYTENCETLQQIPELPMCSPGYELSGDGTGCGPIAPAIEFPADAFKVTLTGMDAGEVFDFQLAAQGTFYVDWGDGNIETITKADASLTTHAHAYAATKNYTVRFTGLATKYRAYTADSTPISFDKSTNKLKMTGIAGNLGKMFPVVDSSYYGSPHFRQIFSGCKNLAGQIPANLFDGPDRGTMYNMFSFTFAECEKLTGPIPKDLFKSIKSQGSWPDSRLMFNYTFYGCKGLTGDPATGYAIPPELFSTISTTGEWMFLGTFYGCSGLSGKIPENLFSTINGAPQTLLFASTFSGCSGLTGPIPENLFAGIKGAPADSMFSSTFANCSGLSGSIPENLFSGITGAPKGLMFSGTFYNCNNLSGPIPEKLFKGISGAPKPGIFQLVFQGCGGLSGPIPENLFAGIVGAPDDSMFDSTFKDCIGLTGKIPGNLFSGISGAPIKDMFQRTFNGCSGLTSIGSGLFDGISGAAGSAMFKNTFDGCSALAGPSATSDGQFLYEKWPTATEAQAGDCYKDATGLSDYCAIPDIWGGDSAVVCAG